MNQNLEKVDKQRSLFDPFRNFFDFDNFFPTMPNWGRQSSGMIPAVNVSEDDKTYYLDVMAPGFKKGDFKVKVEDDMLTISAETKSESTDGKDNNGKGDDRQYTRREYSYSSFTRSFRLPDYKLLFQAAFSFRYPI
jgi:HSP20 family protein